MFPGRRASKCSSAGASGGVADGVNVAGEPNDCDGVSVRLRLLVGLEVTLAAGDMDKLALLVLEPDKDTDGAFVTEVDSEDAAVRVTVRVRDKDLDALRLPVTLAVTVLVALDAAVRLALVRGDSEVAAAVWLDIGLGVGLDALVVVLSPESDHVRV